jgi:hypothetical protein
MSRWQPAAGAAKAVQAQQAVKLRFDTRKMKRFHVHVDVSVGSQLQTQQIAGTTSSQA